MGPVVKAENVMVKCEVAFVQVTKSQGREEVELHSLISSELDGCERRASNPVALPPVPIQ